MSNSPTNTTRGSTLFIIGSTFAIFLTQILLVFRPEIGIFVNALALVYILHQAAIKPHMRLLGAAISIIPTLNIISLTFQNVNPMVQVLITYVLMIVLTIAYRHLSETTYSRSELLTYLTTLPLVVISGLILAFIQQYVFPQTGEKSLPLYIIIAVTPLFAFAETFLFQATIQHELEQSTSRLNGVIIASFLFTSLFFNVKDLRQVPVMLAVGMILSLLYTFRHNYILTTCVNMVLKIIIIIAQLYFALHWLPDTL